MMTPASKTKPLIIIIIFLLVTNIVMLALFINSGSREVRKPKGREMGGMYNSLKNKVGFTQAQLGQYQSLRKTQMTQVKSLFNEVRQAKREFYGLIYSDSSNDSIMKSDAASIAQKQMELDKQMFAYFKSIRDICTTEQKPQFDSTLKVQVARMVGGHSGKNTKEQKK